MDFLKTYDAHRRGVEESLVRIMEASEAPQPLLDAMRYSLLAGGKRVRPVLLLAACEAACGDVQEAMPYACALEMIHTYSLIHDDLPAMDDDDLRRGKPTNHRVYGEGMAVLAGDGLLSFAFETMLKAASTPWHIAAMREIARAAGTEGMVAGQCVDVRCEDSSGGPVELAYIERHKTADLFIGAVGAGLQIAKADETLREAGRQYATELGTAFQIHDDLLDIEGDEALLGKATGMDAAHGKLTWPAVHGILSAREAVQEKTQKALDALAPFGQEGQFLQELAGWLLSREQ